MNGRILRGRRNIIRNINIDPDQLVRNYFYNSNDEELRIPINSIDNPPEFLIWLINEASNYFGREQEAVILSLDNSYFYTLNQNFRQQQINNVNDFFYNQIEQFDSDAEVLQNWHTGSFISLQIRSRIPYLFDDDPNPNHRAPSGAFFNKTHNTKLDLTRYGIYTKNELKNYEEIYKDNCLLKCFKNHKNISEEQINKLKTMIYYDNIPRIELTKISKALNVKIILYTLQSNNTKRKNPPYNKEATNVVEIGLLNNHYFIMEKTNYCKNDINKHLDSKIKMDSFSLIRFLLYDELVSHCLEDISYNSDILKTQYFEKVNPIINNLNYSEESYKLMKEKKYYEDEGEEEEEEEEEKEKNIIFFDFETYTDDKTNQHIPYLCCSIGLNDKKAKTFYGEDCGRKFLNHIKKSSILIAHNASYDVNFLVKYIFFDKIIRKGNKLIQLKGKTLSKIKIEIKCSYLMISEPLRNFGKIFNLEQGKEVMNYDIYHDFFNRLKKGKIKKQQYKIDKATKNMSEEDKKQFNTNIKDWNCQKGTKFFDLIEYSKRYCEIDCEVLRDGYKKFREWILDSCELDINKILTSASLADKYFIKEKCFEGIYELSGVPRKFIQNCLVGGRCMSNQNKKYNLNEKISDFDAVNLYGSSINRLGGYLKGLPKILKQDQLNYQQCLKGILNLLCGIY